jgi:ABC-type bacteriocin/lantibiotic exporter with double-glycine peptidase domain
VKVFSSIRRAVGMLAQSDRKRLLVAALAQMSLSVLDLIGVLLLGVVTSLGLSIIQGSSEPSSVTSLQSFFGITSWDQSTLIALLSVSAVLVLVIKSVSSIFITRRILRFLANRQTLVSRRLVSSLLSRPLLELQVRSSQETSYALTTGVTAATVTLLGQTITALSEFSVLLLMGVVLFYVDPAVCLIAATYFGALAFLLQHYLGKWSNEIGNLGAKTDIESLNAVQEALATYREIYVTDRRQFYVDRIQGLRKQGAAVASNAIFIAQIPKFILEIGLVLGLLALSTFLFLTTDSTTAITTLVIFMAAASRVIPSLMRLQGAAIQISDSSARATSTFDLSDWLTHVSIESEGLTSNRGVNISTPNRAHVFSGEILITEVFAQYGVGESFGIKCVSLRVPAGTSIALVGDSGAGKSTLADVMLGILNPISGEALISGISPQDAVRQWPGLIGYVPQEVALVHGTIRENVALGIDPKLVDDDQIWEALRRSHLADFLTESRDGLDTPVGERGIKLSGGQRQRLGLARALYSRPKLLILDEATSALDAATELGINQTIKELHGDVTTVVIAHRLATILSVDQVCYLENGEIMAVGTFQEVRDLVSGFDQQARILGL